MRRLALVLVLAALVPCGCVTPRQAMASHRWLEVKTSHFRMLTDADPKSAARAAAELERYRRAMLLLWSPDANPAELTYVAMLRNRLELYEVAGKDVSGYWARFGPDEAFQVLVVSADELDGLTPRSVLRHELAHAVTDLVVDRPPHWVAEGISEYLETARITASGEVQLGAPNPMALGYLSNIGLMDLDKLWGWSPADHGEIGQYYAAAWTLLHYLVTERPQQFAIMMRELAAGRDGQGAWRAAFGDAPLSAHWGAVRDHAARGRWQLLTSPLSVAPEEPGVRVLSEGEVHAALAWLQLVSRRKMELGARLAGYRREVELAAWLDPAGPLVKQVSGWRENVDRIEQYQARRESVAKEPAVCPEDVAAGAPLSPGAWAPRSMVKDFAPSMLRELDPGVRGVTDGLAIELAAGEVLISTGAPGGAPALVVLRRAGSASCVVNGWRDETRQVGDVSIASWWKSTDGTQVLVLLSVDVMLQEGLRDRRWMALATDGKRAWWAAQGRGGGAELSGQEPRLRRGGGKVALELKALTGGAINTYPLAVAGELGAARAR